MAEWVDLAWVAVIGYLALGGLGLIVGGVFVWRIARRLK